MQIKNLSSRTADRLYDRWLPHAVLEMICDASAGPKSTGATVWPTQIDKQAKGTPPVYAHLPSPRQLDFASFPQITRQIISFVLRSFTASFEPGVQGRVAAFSEVAFAAPFVAQSRKTVVPDHGTTNHVALILPFWTTSEPCSTRCLRVRRALREIVAR